MAVPCTPTWIRTRGRRFRKPVLYPAELWEQIFVGLAAQSEVVLPSTATPLLAQTAIYTAFLEYAKVKKEII